MTTCRYEVWANASRRNPSWRLVEVFENQQASIEKAHSLQRDNACTLVELWNVGTNTFIRDVIKYER